ncbi:MAG TPA: Ig-like domain-containing protein [Chitinophagaceae bacterium]|jgi:hypothetical protein|nr:Ig-like domain-containing protein [Chitinophagaceae bacterium]
MKSLVFIFSLAFLGIGCSKGSGEKDTVFPVITIDNPVNNQVFNAGDNIPITGTITDDKFIAEVHIHVSNLNTGVLLMDVHLFPNGSSVSFNQFIVASAGFNYKIQVIAKDRAVNQSLLSREVSCN